MAKFHEVFGWWGDFLFPSCARERECKHTWWRHQSHRVGEVGSLHVKVSGRGDDFIVDVGGEGNSPTEKGGLCIIQQLQYYCGQDKNCPFKEHLLVSVSSIPVLLSGQYVQSNPWPGQRITNKCAIGTMISNHSRNPLPTRVQVTDCYMYLWCIRALHRGSLVRSSSLGSNHRRQRGTIGNSRTTK